MALTQAQAIYLAARRRVDAWFVRFNPAGTTLTSTNVQDAIAEVASAGGGGAWGGITGTLSAQTDLQSALDAKLDDSQLDTDGALGTNSDAKIATQKAVKTYVDARGADVIEVQVFS